MKNVFWFVCCYFRLTVLAASIACLVLFITVAILLGLMKIPVSTYGGAVAPFVIIYLNGFLLMMVVPAAFLADLTLNALFFLFKKIKASPRFDNAMKRVSDITYGEVVKKPPGE